MSIQTKIDNGREYRNFQIPFEVRAASDDAAEMIVEGYATVFNQPYTLFEMDGYRVDEQVDARAFDECDMEDVIFQYDHEGRVFARISNNTLELSTDDTGLKVRANLGGTEIGRQLYQEIKGGYTNKMSFGFTIEKDTTTETDDNGNITVLRTIDKVRKLYDVSAVSLPANDATSISARNYGDGVIAEIKAERQRADEARKQLEHKTKALQLRIKLNLMED